MKTENSHSHQSSYAPLAPSQSAVPPPATTKTTAPQPVALHPTVSVPFTPPPWSQPLSAASPSKQKTKVWNKHPAGSETLCRMLIYRFPPGPESGCAYAPGYGDGVDQSRRAPQGKFDNHLALVWKALRSTLTKKKNLDARRASRPWLQRAERSVPGAAAAAATPGKEDRK
ncbi:uncharacterized protein BO95DRAFT_71753 [Aspergillus brunneoviolaceus CBS 621.78]|uniref:Uncharacterized protein n=1 Tax=Aspergillus brunneoviolaceus CBS 621.78 TaxID=1450534 RepID=A0ACD1GEY6_9EURO|nr:hypothetical protein BO95DRAFT_71753 [Aspergillus brunneoviolaceus CBS 621.78]RAH47880.1 hypothetical protein BO95DRAFT_71753 [Aspergillus brunneoviolaceus CBS 621.78]